MPLDAPMKRATRIIAGSARGMPLRVPSGVSVRPTSGRVRTSLFSILAHRVEGARVADLFAGCGALGLEALSRGAAWCCFVENAAPALSALEDNLARSRLEDKAQILPHEAFAVTPLLLTLPPFDIVLLDPPYHIAREEPARLLAFLDELASGDVLAPGGLMVVQHAARVSLPDAIGPLAPTDRRVYGSTALTFLERASGRAAG
jgi:16S rRNA (guanine966-N2)-methyltransferase